MVEKLHRKNTDPDESLSTPAQIGTTVNLTDQTNTPTVLVDVLM